MAKKQILRQDAAEASRAGSDLMHEIMTLHEVANVVRHGDDSGDEIAQNQLVVLQNTIDEKMDELYDAAFVVNDYFLQVPKSRKKKKLTKKAA